MTARMGPSCSMVRRVTVPVKGVRAPSGPSAMAPTSDRWAQNGLARDAGRADQGGAGTGEIPDHAAAGDAGAIGVRSTPRFGWRHRAGGGDRKPSGAAPGSGRAWAVHLIEPSGHVAVTQLCTGMAVFIAQAGAAGQGAARPGGAKGVAKVHGWARPPASAARRGRRPGGAPHATEGRAAAGSRPESLSVSRREMVMGGASVEMVRRRMRRWLKVVRRPSQPLV
jgi:hypothetical protein